MTFDSNKVKKLAELLISKNMTLATAESCTGGLVGDLITDIPGSSAYYLGGVISYSNESKKGLLGVKQQTLDKYGAVSEQTAREMAEGVRKKFQSDVSVSITGMAGPEGGSESKPVGLTYIAVSSEKTTIAHTYFWKGDRKENKIYSAEAAIKACIDLVRM
jgi:PncC family amidohydrolase